MTYEQERQSEIDRLTKMLYYDWERRSVFKAGVEYADNHPKVNWISVDEALPQDNLLVLTVDVSQKIQVCHRANGKWDGNSNITHWQTLPKPPRKEIYD